MRFFLQVIIWIIAVRGAEILSRDSDWLAVAYLLSICAFLYFLNHGWDRRK